MTTKNTDETKAAAASTKASPKPRARRKATEVISVTAGKAEAALEKAGEVIVDKAENASAQVKKAASRAAKDVERVRRPTPIWIQSSGGGSITVEEVMDRVDRITGGADAVYIKPEDNKAYFVKNGQTGSVALW